jgi:transposase
MEGKARPNNRPRKRPSLLERVNPNAAGIDCGSAEHYAAVPVDRDVEPVRRFKTFTADLHRLADWLASCRIETVAIESTSVYWIPIYEILVGRGIQVVLVNARHLKNAPGRKSDVTDCEWLRDLHSVGLLRGSFRPEEEIVTLRSYLRHRETLVQSAATMVTRMQKALVQMNLQLPVVIKDIIGLTGLRIIRDIVEGETDPAHLAKHRDPHCRASEAEIRAALTGHYRAEHLFALKQNLELFDALQRQVEACDVQIEACLAAMAAKMTFPSPPLPAPRHRRNRRSNEPQFDVRTILYRLVNTDLSQLDGIGPHAALRLISEIGTDMSHWRTERHFTSWLTLAPNNRVSGGRLLSSKTQPSANRAAAIFRMAAMSLARTQTGLGAFYRRLACRIGKAKAITATARKLAILVYRCLKGEIVYKDPGAAAYDLRHRDSVVRRLRRRAAALGFNLVSGETGEILDGVS